jgi:hypothetical protein
MHGPDRSRLHEVSREFFELRGSAFMKLNANAAIEVCLRAAAQGLVVARVEGGIWHAPGFEARGDCIWDGVDPPVDRAAAHLNNLEAAEFIAEERQRHSAFVITAPPIKDPRCDGVDP